MDTFLCDNATEKEIATAAEYIIATLYEAKLNRTFSNGPFL